MVRSTSSPNKRGNKSTQALRTCKSLEVVPLTTISRARPWSVSTDWSALIPLKRTFESMSTMARSAKTVAILDSRFAKLGKVRAATLRTSTSSSLSDHEIKSQTEEPPRCNTRRSKPAAFLRSFGSSSRSNVSMWFTTTSGHVSHNALRPFQAASERWREADRSSFPRIVSTAEGKTGAVTARQRLAATRTLASSSSSNTDNQSNNSFDLRTAISGSTLSAATRTSPSSCSSASINAA